MRRWFDGYDRNLPLLDLIHDPAANGIAVRLAALSLGEPADGGFYDAEALADVAAHHWSEFEDCVDQKRGEASTAMADLLDRGGPYTRSLYEVVKLLPLRDAARHLQAHARRMMDRADMIRLANEAGAVIA